MITNIHFQNFRSIADSDIDLGRITILTGANNCGKSSIIYGLLALKNVVGNPNQSLDSCLTLPFMNLGGFSQIVHKKNEESEIVLGIQVNKNNHHSQYTARLGKKQSSLKIKSLSNPKIIIEIEVTFPYAVNKNTGCEIKAPVGIFKITWNGISPTINFEKNVEAKEEEIVNTNEAVHTIFNAPVEALRTIDFIPLRRGFSKPVYTSVIMQPLLITEDELATLLASDRDLEGKVAVYLEKIVDRVFSVRPTLGTGNFNLQTRDRNTGFVTDLVNEGFGTNQLISILSKVLKKEVRLICIEESEIHLHPSIMDKLVSVFIEIARDEDKQFLISSHSEHIVTSLLNKVANKKLALEELKVYYLNKEKQKTKIELQGINEKGQIKGGLKSFYDTELNEIKDFFKINE
ncbi:MAG: AAA family ATPase [Bacteroidia bacterium]|nr:AAA family ATPase [Bacteroidia bacterium]